MNRQRMYRKAWEVVAFTCDGSVFCPDCNADLKRDYFDGAGSSSAEWPRPVFVSDDYADLVCNRCLVPID